MTERLCSENCGNIIKHFLGWNLRLDVKGKWRERESEREEEKKRVCECTCECECVCLKETD